jgi:hypothetical protein
VGSPFSRSDVRRTQCGFAWSDVEHHEHIDGRVRLALATSHATCRSDSSRLSHSPTWFQLANVRVTSLRLFLAEVRRSRHTILPRRRTFRSLRDHGWPAIALASARVFSRRLSAVALAEADVTLVVS